MPGSLSCSHGCRGYVTAITAGQFERAYRIARESNPLSSLCGRICNAPCEAACRRGSIDEPIAIRALKRFVTQRFGVEARRLLPVAREARGGEALVGPGDSTTSHDRTALRRLAASPSRLRGRIAVVGSGPAGLACAHDLALLGHEVVIFESNAQPGGMLRLGVPPYRLDRQLLDLEIEAILDLGIELRLDTVVGRDVTLAGLRTGFEAVFLAAGLNKGRDLRIEGAELDGVFKAIDFLLNVNLGYRVDPGRKVLVIGGGNVAVDAARMAVRHRIAQADLADMAPSVDAPAKDEQSLHSAFDVARTALRSGAAEVHMIALEDWHGLPASRLEIEEALEEGIQIHTRLGPSRILGSSGRANGSETIGVAWVFDEEGRFNPKFIPGAESLMEGDTVILAIGQTADLTFLEGADDIQVSPRGLVVADPHTLATTALGVFAGGDLVYGPRILIEAVRDGQLAACAIDDHIQGRPHVVVRQGRMVPVGAYPRPPDYTTRRRAPVPRIPLDRRIGIAEVEVGYDEATARAQAERCLQCGLNTVFDSEKCILCGGCVDICPWNCLRIVRATELSGEKELMTVVHARGGSGPSAAILKDQTLCTRCALCAERCPTGAITMELLQFDEELVEP
ncbi:MAG: FAD-dependent oxidoreductase [Chloroflexota bacterium]